MKPLQESIKLHKDDNVSIAINQLKQGQKIGNIIIQEDIPPGYKFANKELKAGDKCYRYGAYIGDITRNVKPGNIIHVQNLSFTQKMFKRSTNSLSKSKSKLVKQNQIKYFKGFIQKNKEVATRNYIGVISTVNCANTVVDEISNYFRFGQGSQTIKEINHDETLLDGIVPIKHNLGCAMQKDGAGHKLLKRTLEGYALHPNFCFVLVIGLGCEVNNMSYIQEQSESIHYLSIQEEGGSKKTSEEAIRLLDSFISNTHFNSRSLVPLSNLKVSLQCGGSDSFSGITANPLLGMAMDKLVENGGTAVLGETPEIYGAEHLLIERAVNKNIANKLIDKVKWWEDYASSLGESINNNPSSGNIMGGISNIAEKSLGAVAKSGSSPLIDVLDYAQRIINSGLMFMDTPGYDPVSVTGHIAGGCNLVCFTTGRGSAFGSFPSPTIKISSNNDLFNNQSQDIDFNAGLVLDAEADMNQIADNLLSKIVNIASGERSKSEDFGYGYNEFVPWHLGAVL